MRDSRNRKMKHLHRSKVTCAPQSTRATNKHPDRIRPLTFRVARTLRKLRVVAHFGAIFSDKQTRTQRCLSVYLDDAESFEGALGLGLCAMLDCGVLNLARSIIEPGSNSLPQVRVGLGEVPKDMHEHGLNRQVFS